MRLGSLQLALLASMAASTATAQSETRRVLVSVSGGLGVATPALGAMASLALSHRTGDYMLRVTETTDFELFRPSDTTGDVAVLYGLRRSWSSGWARAAVGVAGATHVDRDRIRECEFFSCRDVDVEKASSTVGVASQVDLVWAPDRHAGIGVALFGNLNDQQSFAGLTLTAHLGGIR